MKCIQQQTKRGSVLLYTLLFGALAVSFIISGVSGYALFENRASVKKEQHDLALHIAEAGLEYYRWHLAHAPEDYTDGTGQTIPHVHEFKDKNGTVAGYFSLVIIAPAAGTTEITIMSTGWTVREPNSKRTVQMRAAFDSFTDYAILSHSNVNVGLTTYIHGPLHSNGGIRFDGTTDAWITSARQTYSYSGSTKNGIWGVGTPTEFWRFPVPAVDFTGVTADLANIKSKAIAEGIHLTSSGSQGWHIKFKSNGTIDIYKVTSVSCYSGDVGSYCYDINNETFIQNRAMPANGHIYAEDHVWVEGIVGTRVTVAAGRLPEQPSNYRNIYIPNNITYTVHASSTSLGLLTQGDVIVPRNVPTNMTIESAILSQYGKIRRPYYTGNTRASLTVYGSQIAYNGAAWKYVNGSGTVLSGFIVTNHNYDPNLRYYPPPGFPVGNAYERVSWDEI